MRISGFTFLRNADSLGYPFLEALHSALPLVDEFVIALAEGDSGDATGEKLRALGSEKIRLIPTRWDLDRFPGGTIYARQTDIAKEACRGDWLLYLQADEILHEDDLEGIRSRCDKFVDDPRVEGMVFDYVHFWGSFNRHFRSHAWYAREIRIIRNDPDIHSFNDAQSFLRNSGFDGRSYRDKTGTSKLDCVHSGARIFHYGHVRPPRTMEAKNQAFQAHHRETSPGGGPVDSNEAFEYGAMKFTRPFAGSHPKIMGNRIADFHWGDALHDDVPTKGRVLHKHERLRHRVATWVENRFFGGRALFQSEHFRLLTDRSKV